MILFFFFKQKTAYEMRISDWSSDVCSSDLPHFFDGWYAGNDGFGDFYLGFGGGAERQAVVGGLLHGVYDLRVRVPQYGGAPGPHIIDVAGIVGIPNGRAAGALDKPRGAAHRPKGAYGRTAKRGGGKEGGVQGDSMGWPW